MHQTIVIIPQLFLILFTFNSHCEVLLNETSPPDSYEIYNGNLTSGSGLENLIEQENSTKHGRAGRFYQESAQVATDFNWIRQAISQHNYYRYQHNAPPLRFNITLCQISQAYANRMARENLWGHNYNILNKYGLGENLAKYSQSGTRRYVNSSVSVDLWYREINDYDFAAGWGKGNRAVGHFTQLVWRSTYQMGTAFAIRRQGNRNTVFVVANYYPRGNVGGAYKSNVSPRRRWGKALVPEKGSTSTPTWSLEQVNQENNEAIERAMPELHKLFYDAVQYHNQLTNELSQEESTTVAQGSASQYSSSLFYTLPLLLFFYTLYI